MTTEAFVPSGEVKGLTDRPRLPRLGKIHLGIRTTNARGSEFPRATDFFVAPEVVQQVYGPKPRELDVVFPSDDVGRVAGVSWKQYSATRGKICWGDGERAIRMIDLEKLPRRDRFPEYSQDEYDAAIATKDSTKTARMEIACPAKDCVFAKRNQCRPVMNLLVMLPKVPGIGIWQLDTGSTNSILDIRGGIELVMRLSGGRLAGIPLKLRLEPMEVISPEDQKKKIVHTLKLISPATLGKVLMAGERNLRELLMADESPSRSVGLPELTEGRDVPPPTEPEEDLFTEEQRGTVSILPSPATNGPSPAPAGVAQSTSARTSEKERGRSTAEDAGSTPAPRSEPNASTATPEEWLERAEQLFTELDIQGRDRGVYLGAYKGKPAELVKFLEANLEKRRTKK